jgi:hypothetical protein
MIKLIHSNELDVYFTIVELGSIHNFLRTRCGLLCVKLDQAITFTHLPFVLSDVALVDSAKVFESFAQLEAIHGVRQIFDSNGVSRGGCTSTLLFFNFFASLNH